MCLHPSATTASSKPGRNVRRHRYPGQQCRAAAADAVPGDVTGGVARNLVRSVLDGAFILCRTAVPHMLRHGRRRDRRAVGDFHSCRDPEPLSCLGLEGGVGGFDAGAGDRTGAARDHLQHRGPRSGGYGSGVPRPGPHHSGSQLSRLDARQQPRRLPQPCDFWLGRRGATSPARPCTRRNGRIPT